MNCPHLCIRHELLVHFVTGSCWFSIPKNWNLVRNLLFANVSSHHIPLLFLRASRYLDSEEAGHGRGQAGLAALVCILQVWCLLSDLRLALPRPTPSVVCCLWISVWADKVLILELEGEEMYQ